MNRWRFAFERRWFGYLAMAVVFAIACGFLSHWQFGRNNETVTAKNLLNRNYAAAAVPLRELLPTKAAYTPQEEWREVIVKGHYEPGKELLVRDRSYGSNPGFEVLTPFRLTDGSVFVIDRGWVPIGTQQERPDVVPAPPTGTVRATARLQGSEAVLPGRIAPSGEISEISLPTVEKMTGTKMYTGAYGLLMTETPAPEARPVKAVKPTIDNGPFLSYAFQWILFAILGFVGLFWALRQEYRLRNADDPEERARAAARARKAGNRPRGDAEIEDAQIAGVWVPEAPAARKNFVPSGSAATRTPSAGTSGSAPAEANAADGVPADEEQDSAAVEHPILYLN